MPETIGLVLGKFMPPHVGHRTLIEFGRRMCDRLYIHVCTIEREPIPGHLRVAWMREAFPHCEIVHHDDEVPQYPHECPERFYEIWRENLLKRMPRPPDFVFAGEGYGSELAEALGSRYVPLSRRDLPFDICATDVRKCPMRHWDVILEPARPYFLKRVALVGPESVGKSTLAARLAREFGTVHVPEYGRTYTDTYGMNLAASDFVSIAHGHRAMEDALAPLARGVLVSDTEAVVTAMWAEYLTGAVPPEVEALAAEDRYDLYLLLPPTEPWVQDGTRVQEELAVRRWFFDGCTDRLKGRRFVTLNGNHEERLTQGVEAVRRIVEVD